MGNIIKAISEVKPLIKEIKGLVNTVKPTNVRIISPKKLMPHIEEAKRVMSVSHPAISKLLVTDANQATETTKGLNLDLDLGEIIGQTRLALKNIRDYYHGSQFRTRLKRAGFNEEESDLAVKEIDKVLEKSTEKGIYIGDSLYLDSSRIGPDVTGTSTTYGNIDGKYTGNRTQVFTDRAPSIEDFISTLFHEYGGHTSTASIGHHLSEAFNTSEFPMINKMINYNNSLPLKLKKWDISLPDVKKLIRVNDKGMAFVNSIYLKDLIKETSLSPHKLYTAIEEKFPNLSSNYIDTIVSHLMDIRDKQLFYLTTPTEVRARAFELATGNTGKFRNLSTDIFDTADWNAYLNQFLKNGAKLLPRKKLIILYEKN